MKFWDDKDANGNKLTDGRICLVIQSDETPDMPEIRIYGKDKEEILDKQAKTIETAQTQIHRMRKTPPPAQSSTARPVATAPPSPAGDLVTAVADLANPAKAGAAVKTLLKSVGVDVDRDQMVRALQGVANMAAQWEREHPDYPKDPRNDQMLMNKASLIAGHTSRITAEHLDAAFEDLQRLEMLHEPKTSVTVQPRGNEDSRTVRNATSYRRNGLRSELAAPAPREGAKEQRWRDILEKGTGKALEDAIRNEPGFQEWVDKQYAKTA